MIFRNYVPSLLLKFLRNELENIEPSLYIKMNIKKILKNFKPLFH